MNLSKKQLGFYLGTALSASVAAWATFDANWDRTGNAQACTSPIRGVTGPTGCDTCSCGGGVCNDTGMTECHGEPVRTCQDSLTGFECMGNYCGCEGTCLPPPC
jgi:hypothetical protein